MSDHDPELRTLRPLSTFLREVGVTPVTGYRWRQRGWIKAVVIAGRLYVTAEAVADFHQRAIGGEFRRAQRSS